LIDKLKVLYELQTVDDQLDQLEELRGDLPLTVNDLTARIKEKQDQIDNMEKEKNGSIEKRKSNEEETEKLTENLKRI